MIPPNKLDQDMVTLRGPSKYSVVRKLYKEVWLLMQILMLTDLNFLEKIYRHLTKGEKFLQEDIVTLVRLGWWDKTNYKIKEKVGQIIMAGSSPNGKSINFFNPVRVLMLPDENEIIQEDAEAIYAIFKYFKEFDSLILLRIRLNQLKKDEHILNHFNLVAKDGLLCRQVQLMLKNYVLDNAGVISLKPLEQ